MSNIAGEIKQRMQGGTTREWVDDMMSRYPYFNLPMLLYLKEHGTEGNEQMLARLAIASPDRKALAMQLGEGVEQFADFYKPVPDTTDTPDTDNAIDRFLEQYGNSNEREIEALSNAIFNPAPDYADILAAEQGNEHAEPASEQDRLIDNFIAESEQRQRAVAQAPAQPHVEEHEKAEVAHDSIEQPEHLDDSLLQESLAKTYIAQRRYRQALEIIENINLRFPEKSIYFADQIRFLRKLVLNETITNKQ